eukprot:6194550-Pleurochrysis_carterae.AAC.2
MGMMRGLRPVSASNDDRALRGGPVVRLSTPTACKAVNVQNDLGAEAAVRLKRVDSMIDLMARSATPFSW